MKLLIRKHFTKIGSLATVFALAACSNSKSGAKSPQADGSQPSAVNVNQTPDAEAEKTSTKKNPENFAQSIDSLDVTQNTDGTFTLNLSSLSSDGSFTFLRKLESTPIVKNENTADTAFGTATFSQVPEGTLSATLICEDSELCLDYTLKLKNLASSQDPTFLAGDAVVSRRTWQSKSVWLGAGIRERFSMFWSSFNQDIPEDEKLARNALRQLMGFEIGFAGDLNYPEYLSSSNVKDHVVLVSKTEIKQGKTFGSVLSKVRYEKPVQGVVMGSFDSSSFSVGGRVSGQDETLYLATGLGGVNRYQGGSRYFKAGLFINVADFQVVKSDSTLGDPESKLTVFVHTEGFSSKIGFTMDVTEQEKIARARTLR